MVKGSVWAVLLSLLLLQQVVASPVPGNGAVAARCSAGPASISNELLKIHTALDKVETRFQYRNHLRERYESVEQLLNLASFCKEESAAGVEVRGSWSSLHQAMVSLRSSARESAFSAFQGWLGSIERDREVMKAVLPPPSPPSD